MKTDDPASLCPDGVTISFWLKLRPPPVVGKIDVIRSHTQNGLTFVAVKQPTQIKWCVLFKTFTKTWYCVFYQAYSFTWHMFTFTWHAQHGFKVLLDANVVNEDKVGHAGSEKAGIIFHLRACYYLHSQCEGGYWGRELGVKR